MNILLTVYHAGKWEHIGVAQTSRRTHFDENQISCKYNKDIIFFPFTRIIAISDKEFVLIDDYSRNEARIAKESISSSLVKRIRKNSKR